MAQNLASTQTGLDIITALRKRLETLGHPLPDQTYRLLMLDIMAVLVADAANVAAHSTAENNASGNKPFYPKE